MVGTGSSSSYYRGALEAVSRDSRQAVEKLWDSITALINLHAALKGVFIAVRDRGKLVNYVADNIEERYWKVFHDLLKTGRDLHIRSYEGYLAPETFTLF